MELNQQLRIFGQIQSGHGKVLHCTGEFPQSRSRGEKPQFIPGVTPIIIEKKNIVKAEETA